MLHRRVLVLALASLTLVAAGCNRRAKTPAEAFERLGAAIKGRDPAKLYAALDLPTRWSWMTVRHAHREAYDIVLSNFPEGAAREQELRRFEAGALAESEAALFASQFGAQRWDELARDLAAAKPPAATGEGAEATAALEGGKTWRFRRGDDGGWGFAELATEAEDLKKRASADLELVRENAADLERAATRAGK